MSTRALTTGAMLAAVLSTLPSCIFSSFTLPLAYRSPTPADVGGIAHLGPVTEGHACSHMVLGLVAFGDGGFSHAMEQATAHAQAVVGASGAQAQAAGTVPANALASPALLADVQADTSALNVLGIYQRRCTVIHARIVQ